MRNFFEFVEYHSTFVLIYFQRDATLHSLFISGKLLYMFRVVSAPITRSTYNCIYSIWYLLTITGYLPLLWESWSWSECGVGIVPICDVSSPIIRSTYNCIYSIWYLLSITGYLPLLWESWSSDQLQLSHNRGR